MNTRFFPGYHALPIMGLPENGENTKPSHFKKDISATKYVFLQAIYNLRFIGPIVMGMGGFVLLCVWVVMYNEKDRLANGESKMISSDDDVYNKAIQVVLRLPHISFSGISSTIFLTKFLD